MRRDYSSSCRSGTHGKVPARSPASRQAQAGSAGSSIPLVIGVREVADRIADRRSAIAFIVLIAVPARKSRTGHSTCGRSSCSRTGPRGRSAGIALVTPLDRWETAGRTGDARLAGGVAENRAADLHALTGRAPTLHDWRCQRTWRARRAPDRGYQKTLEHLPLALAGFVALEVPSAAAQRPRTPTPDGARPLSGSSSSRREHFRAEESCFPSVRPPAARRSGRRARVLTEARELRYAAELRSARRARHATAGGALLRPRRHESGRCSPRIEAALDDETLTYGSQRLFPPPAVPGNHCRGIRHSRRRLGHRAGADLRRLVSGPVVGSRSSSARCRSAACQRQGTYRGEQAERARTLPGTDDDQVAAALVVHLVTRTHTAGACG